MRPGAAGGCFGRAYSSPARLDGGRSPAPGAAAAGWRARTPKSRPLARPTSPHAPHALRWSSRPTIGYPRSQNSSLWIFHLLPLPQTTGSPYTFFFGNCCFRCCCWVSYLYDDTFVWSWLTQQHKSNIFFKLTSISVTTSMMVRRSFCSRIARYLAVCSCMVCWKPCDWRWRRLATASTGARRRLDPARLRAVSPLFTPNTGTTPHSTPIVGYVWYFAMQMTDSSNISGVIFAVHRWEPGKSFESLMISPRRAILFRYSGKTFVHCISFLSGDRFDNPNWFQFSSFLQTYKSQKKIYFYISEERKY